MDALTSPAVSENCPGIVLLAAGRGERLRPLTENTPKSLLPICGRPTIGWVLDAALRTGATDIVVVTGFRQDAIRAYIAENFPGDIGKIQLIHNERYSEDVNIYSTSLGVEALKDRSKGYIIIETDLVIERSGWDKIFACGRSGRSFWVTKGRYSRSLTGGIVRADPAGPISDIAYVPEYDPAYDGWLKMVGVLGVSPSEVAADQSWRKATMKDSIRKYYLESWVAGLRDLPCVALDLGDSFMMTYNSERDYMRALDESSNFCGRL